MLEVHVQNTVTKEELLMNIGEEESAGLIITSTQTGEQEYNTSMTGYFNLEEGLSFIAHMVKAVSQKHDIPEKLILNIVGGAIVEKEVMGGIVNENIN